MRNTVILLLFFIATPILAANTTGYAWSESLGWFDFSNATVRDTALTGYAYNDNTGWLVLDGIINTNGSLSGYAWSESVGYFNFTNTYIENGAFTGYAYNDNTGWLSFSAGTNVTTTWVIPVFNISSSLSNSTSYSGGSSYKYIPLSLRAPTTKPVVNTPTKIPTMNTNTLIAIISNNRDLKINLKGNDVKILQQFLNSQGLIVNKQIGKPGSLGFESDFFGPATKKALIQFQLKNNIKPALGYLGPKTKMFIKNLAIKI